VSTRVGPWRLVVADLDGTLVTGTTACVHLDDWIGHGPVIRDLERRFASGEITNTQVAETYAPCYRDIALADATAVMAQIPVLDDIALGVSLLSRRCIEAVIATASWSFTAEALADLWGFTRVRGADLEVDDATGLFTGRVSRHCEPEDKVTFVAEQCQRLGGRFRSGRGHRGWAISPAVVPVRRVQASRLRLHPRCKQPHRPLSTATLFSMP